MVILILAMLASSTLDEPVLLLNVNFEPLHACNMRRAIALIMTHKAEVVVNGRGFIRTSSRELEAPSVIRLRYMVKRPRPRLALSKREILRRDNFTCQYCGKKSTNLTIDHVLPRHMGGKHSWENLAAACPACNRRKGGNMMEQVGMALLRTPFEPTPSAEYRFGRQAEQYQEWEPFIAGW